MSRAPRRRKQQAVSWFLPVFLGVVGLALAGFALGSAQRLSPPSVAHSSLPPVNASQSITLTPGHSGVEPMGTVTLAQQDLYQGQLILVNNKTAYQFPENSSLVSVFEEKNSAYKVKDKNVELSTPVLDPLNQMMADYQSATGNGDAMVISGFRTLEYQQMLLERQIGQDGAAEASKWVGSPGGSEHHTGYAIDFSELDGQGRTLDYTGTGDQAWINANCARYGFVVRYPQAKADVTGISYEPWHFRYVGIPHAAVMTERGLCLEEYVDFLRAYPYDGPHLTKELDGATWEIYFVPATGEQTKVPVPIEEPYTISGNNTDGFIVTIQKEPA